MTTEDLIAYLTSYPEEMAFGTESPETVFDRYHTPDIEYRNEGILLNRDRLIAHARPARKNATSCTVEVHDALVCGDRIAARYTLRATMRKGTKFASDIHMFGSVEPDGRIRRVTQIGRELEA
ncbi:nuclear transport factor 2 family protein [Amycolatopsis sp. 195334CR]|uniref:nuclear transport factor 2 family protein n=1 Tax=Amycolatopsis sp. 195334CR TaxID=2814588 RepID=UPI001A8D72C1|nr:nuclear transport factor 2 family protein [Amycolatopsis sp. 195334CR]MBN6036469.1 nuclear transport factor 2 family protein [Amycolatopsis sp. 195334CR]